ncbi:MAG: hypothetical protein M3483_06240 [Gemmatimonadota bacterium]|nr:hypothetical protein [Gemmatimonadota bacterium]
MPSHRTRSAIPGILLGCLLLGACRDESESPERVAARRDAGLNACIAEELAVEAREKEATIEPMAQVMTGPYTYARVYRERAEVEMQRLALADSALHAANPGDSAGFAMRAATYSLSNPAGGSVEENAARAYYRDFAGLRANTEHFCHQERLRPLAE